MGDRGLMKWAAFMMPEHNTMLKNWEKEDDYEERILLSDEQLEELSICLNEAVTEGKPVWLKHYVNKFKFYQKVQCQIVSCDPILRMIRIKLLDNGITQTIYFPDIMHIEII